MGENARRKSDGEVVKIGTCECMYYLRWEDRSKVEKVPNSLDPSACAGLFFRLPFPEEDDVQIGEYENYNRGYRLGRQESDGTSRGDYWQDWSPEEAGDMDPGLIQLRHDGSGLMFNVKCWHGVKLPDVQGDAVPFWNGKGHHFELYMVKHLGGGVLRPVYHCRWCQSMWSTEWDSVLPFCGFDDVMRQRLEAYAAESKAAAARK